MTRRIPAVPTAIVLLAVAVMLALGFWQLDRRAEKARLLARYADAAGNPQIVPLGRIPEGTDWFYRRVSLLCERVESRQRMAGRNAAGESGIAHVASCVTTAGRDGRTVVGRGDIVLGWSRDLAEVEWHGGPVTGVVAPGAGGKPRLVADPPLAGLRANARPDPRDMPDNHLSYAVQWFLFAAMAVVIYGLALRKRLAPGGQRG